MDEAENQINKLEYKEEKKTFNQNSKKKTESPPTAPPKNEDRVGSLWDNFKHSNIHIMAVLEGEEK